MPLSPTLRRRLVAAAVLPVLAACGGDEQAADETAVVADDPDAVAVSEAPTGGPQDPCVLIQPGDVSAAAGLGESTGQPSTSGGAKVCTWTDAEGMTAVVQMFPGPERHPQARQAFEALYGRPADDLEGMDFEGYFIPGRTGSIPTATVGARKGGTAASFQVMSMTADTADLRSGAMELAQRTMQGL